MANNRNRSRKGSCWFCSKGIFVSFVTVNEDGMARVWDLCQTDYVTRALCNPEKHEGDSHSNACRYVKV
jgi:hypothetical protein